MTDKPKVHFSYNDLESESNDPDPFVYTTKASKRVTFPDIFDLPADEGEKFLSDMETLSDSEILKKWLSDKDLKALQEDKLSLRRRSVLMYKVLNYYQGVTGDSGEDTGSENS